MMASWMLYALAISALLTVAAFAAERVFAARGWATRAVWGSALALSIVWPLAPKLAALLPAPARAVRMMPFTIVVQAPTADEVSNAGRALLIDRGLIVLWCVLSALLFVRIAYGVYLIERVRGAWKRGRVDGMRVKLSENVGPAVVGLRSMDVVLPHWILSLDEPLRAIVLRHEDEHRRARDPHLMFASAVAVALMPWNPALWIQAKRLRLAIELDCDARVLRAHPSSERYGLLMLTIAQRRSTAPAMFAPMLSEPATNLERRILAMRTTSRKVARLSVVGGTVITVGVLAFASSLQSASPLPRVVARVQDFMAPVIAAETIPVRKPVPRKTAVEIVKASADTQTVLRLPATQASMAPAQAAPRYPAMLRAAGIEGAVTVEVTTDANGVADPRQIRILASTHDLFTQAVRAAASKWDYQTPNTTVRQTVVFALSGKTVSEMERSKQDWPAGTVVVTAAADEASAVRSPVEPRVMSDSGAYFEFQVEKPVTAVRTNVSPRFPDLLRAAQIEGEVLAQFVVNVDGRPDMSTFKVLKSTHDLFTESVKSALPAMQFDPAQVGGHMVKQVIQMPFQFKLPK